MFSSSADVAASRTAPRACRGRGSRLVLAVAIALTPALLVTGCGGGGDSSTTARAKRLLGAAFAKLTGLKLGELRAELTRINDQMSQIDGTVDLDGTSFTFTGTVDANNHFYVTADNTVPSSGGGSLVLSSIRLTGDLVAPATAGDPIAVTGTWTADLPTSGGSPGSTTAYSGSIVAGTPSSGDGGLPSAGSCDWSATAFYNEQQVVTYNGSGYTAKRAVAPFGSAGAALFNPASDTYNWAAGGSCGPAPFVTVETAVCAKGVSADVVTMTGTAYGGGIGDAIASYTNYTDAPSSVEDSFGLPNTAYSITCSGGGFVGRITSTTSPAYSLCVKTQASSDAMHWSSTQTIPHSSSLIGISTAYASKGNPLLATVFNPGAIVLGLDAVRSDGIPVTGNCN